MALPASWDSGFDVEEALSLAAVCANLNGAVASAPTPPMPSEWKRIASVASGIYDNDVSILQNTARKENEPPQYCVAFRGTMANPLSVWEDADLQMVPADQYSRHSEARIHRGFKDSFESLLPMLRIYLDPLLSLTNDAQQQAHVYVTGHSQGAALAALFTAWAHCSDYTCRPYMRVKSYYFAQPKLGNNWFAEDFCALYCCAQSCGFRSWAFRVTNDLDFMPQLPLTLEFPRDLDGSFQKFVQSAALPSVMRELIEFLDRIQLPVVGTQNYQGVGAPIVLRGRRDATSEPDDYLFQHHCGRYWELINEQFGAGAMAHTAN